MIIKDFERVIDKIFLNKFPEKIAIAVSGGADSLALLFLLKDFFDNKTTEITTLIVDHKFREETKEEIRQLLKILENHKINYEILESYLEKTLESNIESQLREVRYNLLQEFCKNNQIKHLFIGHHKQDQTENFLIRLFRGSGIDGLASMDYISEFNDIKLVRPLLDLKKEDLQNYLNKIEVKWFEDSSNEDEKFLRNKIRNFLNSLDDKDLINDRIYLASRSILENKKIVDNKILRDFSKTLYFSDLGYITINREEFISFSEEEVKKCLSWILMEISGSYYKPRLKYLENLYFDILNKETLSKRCFYGCVIENFEENNIIFYREKSKIEKSILKYKVKWDNRFNIEYNGSDEDIYVDNIDATTFNKLNIKTELKSVLKNVIYTLPVFKKGDQIVAIPHLNYSIDNDFIKNIKILFDKKTKL